MLQLEPGMMIWTWLTFLFLFFVLARVAWKPLLKAVNQREKTIADSLKKADDAQTQAEKYLEEQQKLLAGAQEEIQKMLKENREMAEKMKNEIMEKARQEARKLQERARTDIEQEREAAILELKKHVADLTIQATSFLIGEKLDAQKHRSLIDNYINDLENIGKN